MLTSFQQHVPHKHFGGKITSCTIAGRRCYRTRMYEVIWSNHNLTVLPIKPHISLAPTALLSELCKLHSSFSNQSTLIKIPACKPVRARAEEASEPDTGIHPLLRTCTGSEAQRSLMCTGVFLRVGTQAWCRRRAETIGGSTSSPHTHNPCVSQELFILHLHPPLFFSFFSVRAGVFTRRRWSVLCAASRVIHSCLTVQADHKLILGLILCMCVQKHNTGRLNTKTKEHNERVNDWVWRPWRETASFWGLWVFSRSWTS